MNGEQSIRMAFSLLAVLVAHELRSGAQLCSSAGGPAVSVAAFAAGVGICTARFI